jgi:hypothetical protein
VYVFNSVKSVKQILRSFSSNCGRSSICWGIQLRKICTFSGNAGADVATEGLADAGQQDLRMAKRLLNVFKIYQEGLIN